MTLAPSTIRVTSSLPATAGSSAATAPTIAPLSQLRITSRRNVGCMPDSTLPDAVAKIRQRYTTPLILELDLTEGVAEEPPADPLSAAMAMRRPRLADIVDGLRRARADDRVKALIVKAGGRRIGLAR